MKVTRAYRFFAAQPLGSLRSAMGDHTWPLPKNSKPGAWCKWRGALSLCATGYHYSPTPSAALQERQGDTMGIVEIRGKRIDGDRKGSSQEMRVLRVLEREHVVALAALASVLMLPISDKWSKAKDCRELNAATIAWLKADNPEAKTEALKVSASASASASAYAYAYASASAYAYASASASAAAYAAAYAHAAASAAAYAHAAAKFDRIAIRLLDMPASSLGLYLERLLVRQDREIAKKAKAAK